MNTARTNKEFIGVVEFDGIVIQCLSVFDMMSWIKCGIEHGTTCTQATIFSRGYKFIWSKEVFNPGDFDDALKDLSLFFNIAFGFRGRIEKNMDGTYAFYIKVRRTMCVIVFDFECRNSISIIGIDPNITAKIQSWLLKTERGEGH